MFNFLTAVPVLSVIAVEVEQPQKFNSSSLVQIADNEL
jgi:hypothetical protein